MNLIDLCLLQCRKVAVWRSVPLISKKKTDLKIYILPKKQMEVAQSERVALIIRTLTVFMDIQRTVRNISSLILIFI